MVVREQLVFGTITSNTGSGTQNDPVIIQGNNESYFSTLSYAQIKIIVEPGNKGTLYVKFQGYDNSFIQLTQNDDGSTLESIINTRVEFTERTYVDINNLQIVFQLNGSTTQLPFIIEYYYSAQTSTPSPTLNWMTQRPTYSNNALVFYKSGTANGAVGSVVNSRVISRRT